MTVRAEQRPCLHCHNEFTWTPASPRKRFCSQPCRLAWWGEQRRGKPRPRRRARPAQPPAAAPGERHAAANDVPQPHALLAATPACPHCRQPVAIVAWLVPPAAASVTTPPRHHGTRCDTPQR